MPGWKRRLLATAVRTALFFELVTYGCRRQPRSLPATTGPTVASTVPAATDLIAGMGCADHLVAVTSGNYEVPRPELAGLPKAGDLLGVDWEVLEHVRPQILITGMKPERRPAGFDERAARDHVTTIYLQVDRLDQIAPAIRMLGSQIHEEAKAAAAVKQLDERLQKIGDRSAGRAKVPALLVIGGEPTSVAGPGSYLDDLLAKVGGVNVVTGGGAYVTLDREKLLSLRPQVIIQLMPNASPAELSQAAAAWKNLPAITAAVHVITDAYAVQPGWHVTDLAEKMADDLARH
jgi:iron complex transport system substrate-binding protein